MAFKEIECDVVDWIRLIQDMIEQRVLLLGYPNNYQILNKNSFPWNLKIVRLPILVIDEQLT